MSDDLIEAHGDGRQADAVPASAGAVRLGCRARGDEPAPRRRRLPADRRAPARAPAPTSRCRPTSSSAFRARPRPTFAATLALVEEIGFAQAFSFKYSPRPGTPAASMRGQVKDAIKSERLAELQALLAAQSQGVQRRRPSAASCRCCWSGPAAIRGQMVGRTPYLQPVHLAAPGARPGDADRRRDRPTASPQPGRRAARRRHAARSRSAARGMRLKPYHARRSGATSITLSFDDNRPLRSAVRPAPRASRADRAAHPGEPRTRAATWSRSAASRSRSRRRALCCRTSIAASSAASSSAATRSTARVRMVAARRPGAERLSRRGRAAADRAAADRAALADPGGLSCAPCSGTTWCSGSAPPAPARPISRSPSGVALLKQRVVERLILSRPAVEAGERLGFLPGDMKDKVDPYLRPLYDALQDMLPEGKLAARAGERPDRDGAARLHARPHPVQRLRHPRRGPEHHAGADEDVSDPPGRELAHGGDRRSDPGRPAAGHDLGADRRGRQARSDRDASAWSASPIATSCAILWSRPSSMPIISESRARLSPDRSRDSMTEPMHGAAGSRRGAPSPPTGPCWPIAMDSDGPRTGLRDHRRGPSGGPCSTTRQRCAGRRCGRLLAEPRPRAWLATAEVSVLLGDDRAIRQLNARHREQDRATNVLAFPVLDLDHGRPACAAPGLPGPVLLGDIALALETVCREAGHGRQAARPTICAIWWSTAACTCWASTTRTTPARRDGGSGARDPGRPGICPTPMPQILTTRHRRPSRGDQHAREAV